MILLLYKIGVLLSSADPLLNLFSTAEDELLRCHELISSRIGS
jgi:hypothetical protein